MQIAAMILGILSLVPLSFLGVAGPVGFIGTGVALAAIVLAAIGLKKGEKKGFCIAGLITGIFGLILSLIITVSCTVCYHKIGEAAKNGDLDKFADSLKSLSTTDSTDSTDSSSVDWNALSESLANDIATGVQGLVDGANEQIGDFANAFGDALKGLSGN
ncbi:MAG: hypothetical protein II114_08340 [Treponema sp.]|nr:hypothetical protein [Treponema sp.]MBQ4236815.1 hypothetical protein [Treponema sp.]